MKQPLSLSLLSFVPVAFLALVSPHLLARFITVAVIGEIGFVILVSNRLLELKREQGHAVPFRERYPFFLSLVGGLCYTGVALASLTQLEAQLLALTGAASFAASKLWLSKGRLWPYRGSRASL